MLARELKAITKNGTKYRGITLKLIILSFIFIAITSIISGTIQVYQFKKQGIQDLKERVEEVAHGELIPLSLALWDIDDEKIDLHLEGILSINYVEKVEIVSENYQKSVGKIHSDDIIEKAFPIIHYDKINHRDKTLGTMVISIGLSEIKNKAWFLTQKFIFSELSQIILTCLFMVFLIKTIINDRIRLLNKHTIHLKDKKVFKPLKLHSSSNYIDEFDIFIENFNKLNQEREHHFKVIEEKLRQKNEEFRNILDGLNIGMAVILPNLKIQRDYLKFLPTDLLSSASKNKELDLFTGILSNSTLKIEEVNLIEETLREILGSPTYVYEIKKQLLPLHISIIGDDAKPSLFELTWSPVISNDSFVKKMILQINKKSQNLNEKNLQEIKQKIEINSELISFYQHENTEQLKLIKYYLNRNQLFITEHYSKSSYLSTDEMTKIKSRFNLMTKICQKNKFYILESEIKQVSSSFNNYKKEMKLLFNSIGDVLNKYIEVQKELFIQNALQLSKENTPNSLKISPAKIHSLAKELDGINFDNQLKKEKALKALEKIKTFFQSLQVSDVRKILHEEFRQIPELSKNLGKEIPQITISDSNLLIKSEVFSEIKGIFSNLLKNSIFYEIEAPHLREIHGKEKKAKIDISLKNKDKNFVTITYKDDGIGISTDELQKIGQRGSKRLENSNDNLVNLVIFDNNTSSLSIKSNENLFNILKSIQTISSIVRSLSGRISIRTLPLPLKHENHYPFEIVVDLPQKHFLTKRQSINA